MPRGYETVAITRDGLEATTGLDLTRKVGLNGCVVRANLRSCARVRATGPSFVALGVRRCDGRSKVRRPRPVGH